MTEKRLTPIKAIRQHCLSCSAGYASEVRNCAITDCALYPYRLGKNPYIKREITEEQREAFRERMMKNK